LSRVVRGKDAFLTGLVVALLSAAPAAHASCDRPVANVHAAHVKRGAEAPLGIGVSTLLFGVKYVPPRGLDANARECRSWSEGLGIIRERKRAHRLPPLVIMALGANSWVREIDVRRALRLIGPHRTLGLVTHFTWANEPAPDTALIRRMARRYRKRVRFYDWVRYAEPHPAWFVIDGLHTNELGSRKFAAFLAS
jgi:hypothetical protein